MSAKYVLDADISQCFDQIDHQKLLSKLNTYPTLRKQIRAWLKAGIWEDKKLLKTIKGVPQGGVISPLLANIALHGLEKCVKDFAENLDLKNRQGKQQGKRDKRSSLNIVRYCDDFVILHKDYSVIQDCKELISKWLKGMGLELKPSKTRLTHTLHNVGKEKAGFDFLGFNIRQYKVGKYTCGKKNGKPLGFKTLIKPSRKSIQNHYKQLVDIINQSKTWKQESLIKRLNPIIRGWCNYFSTVVSKKVFSKIDHLINWKLWKWASKRHRNKGKTWLKGKYFQTLFNYDKKKNKFVSVDWIFATTKDSKINQKLLSHAETKIKRYVKVKGEASPYDGNLIYWSSRMGKNPLMPKRKAKLLKSQKRKCNWCGLTFRHGDVLEQDHIIPTSKGGKDDYQNLQLLHRHCHDEKTTIDGSNESSSN